MDECAGRLQGARAAGIRPGRVDHHVCAEFVVLAQIAVEVVHQHQDHHGAPWQVPADLQAAVIDQSLGGVGVHREHRHVLTGLADLDRHREHGAGNGVLRRHGAHCRTVQFGELPDLLGSPAVHDHHRDAGGRPDGGLLADVVDVADDRGIVDELVGDDRRRLVLAVAAEQFGHVVDDLGVPHPAVDIGVEVRVLSAHPAHVERQIRLHRRERGAAVVGDDDVGGRADLEVVAAAAGAGPREAVIEPLVVGVGHPRGVEDRQPPVADLGGQRHVLRALGAQHDRDVGPQRVGDRLEVLTQPRGALAGQRQRIVRAVAGDRRFPGPDLAHDVDVLAGAGQRLRELLAVPSLDDLRARHAEPEDVPPTGQVIQGQRRHRARGRRSRGKLYHRGAEADPAGRGSPPRERGEGVRTPRLGGEQGVEPRRFGGGDQFGGIGRRLRAPITQLKSELHPSLLSGPCDTC